MPEWDTAYYWPEMRTSKVDYVLSKRMKSRTEAGDCWCHEMCYKQSPRTGIELIPVRESKIGNAAHFRSKPNSNSRKGYCKYEHQRTELRESHRYSQFYHDLEIWLLTTEAKNKLKISSFQKSKMIL